MSLKIQRKIVGYDIAPSEPTPAESAAAAAETAEPRARAKPRTHGNITHMHEKVERPEMLVGSTYKIKTPVSAHAFYVTINDMVLNPGTPYEKRRPFEMFINSKNMDHYQWISALTLIVSAVFRKGGDVTFLVEELQSVFDPKGGYFRKGGKFIPSLVAEIGDVIEAHLKMIGLIVSPRLDEHQQRMIDAKRREFEQRAKKQQGAEQAGVASAASVAAGASVAAAAEQALDDADAFPDGAVMCNKCHHKSMIVLDNCLTCLNCGESKCS